MVIDKNAIKIYCAKKKKEMKSLLLSEEKPGVRDPGSDLNMLSYTERGPHFLTIEPNRTWNPGNQAATF